MGESIRRLPPANRSVGPLEAEFLRLRRNHPMVAVFVRIYEDGQCSMEQALMACVVNLCQQNELLVKQVKANPPEPFFIEYEQEIGHAGHQP